jgi:hypothetical protein
MSAGEVAATPQESPADVMRSLGVDLAKGLSAGIVKLMVLPGKYDCGVRGEGHFEGIGCPTVGDLHAMRR